MFAASRCNCIDATLRVDDIFDLHVRRTSMPLDVCVNCGSTDGANTQRCEVNVTNLRLQHAIRFGEAAGPDRFTVVAVAARRRS